MAGYQDNVRKVIPYTPGEQPKVKNIIKLNTNENPYPPAPGVLKALQGVDGNCLKKYPDPLISDLTNALAAYHNVSPKQVFVGVGSDDVLSIAFLTLFYGKDPILFPDITYSFYDVWADLYRIPYETIPLREDFTINAADYKRKNGGVIFANPNAPTGVNESLDFIREILDANRDVAVIVDEAYVDFGGESALPLLKEYDNLLIVRTYSKSRSLANLRIGYAIGSEEMIKYMSDVKFSMNSYTLNAPTIDAGVASLKDEAYFMECRKKVMSTRERSKAALKELGFSFADSMTNFIFATHESVPAKTIFEALREKNIFVRYFNKPRIDNYLRISIGTDEEMDALFMALKEILKRN